MNAPAIKRSEVWFPPCAAHGLIPIREAREGGFPFFCYRAEPYSTVFRASGPTAIAVCTVADLLDDPSPLQRITCTVQPGDLLVLCPESAVQSAILDQLADLPLTVHVNPLNITIYADCPTLDPDGHTCPTPPEVALWLEDVQDPWAAEVMDPMEFTLLVPARYVAVELERAA